MWWAGSAWITCAGSPVFSLQILSPLAQDLFHKAIMESGVAILPYLKAPEEKRNEDVGICACLSGLLSLVRCWQATCLT